MACEESDTNSIISDNCDPVSPTELVIDGLEDERLRSRVEDRTFILVVGDDAVGKTCLLTSYAKNLHPRKNVWEPHTEDIVINYRQYTVTYWEAYGSEESDHRYRRYLYTEGPSIVLICFALDVYNSFENIRRYWVPELDLYIPNTPRIIVGCKSDLRITRPDDCISSDKIDAMAKNLNLPYNETSAISRDGVKGCFEQAVLLALEGKNEVRKQKLKRFFFKQKEKQYPVYPPAPIIELPEAKEPAIQIEASTFAEDWRKMLGNEKFSDVEFLMEEGQQRLAAHKFVLCSTSNLFRQILCLSSNKGSNQGNTDNIDFTLEDLNSGKINGIKAVYQTENYKNDAMTTIELSCDIATVTFKRVLEFLYTGVPELLEQNDINTESTIQELKRVAGIFELQLLEAICTNIGSINECFNPEIGTNVNAEVCKQMKLFFNQPSSADVVFQVEDQNIYANKVVLCARCSVMAAMFGGNFLESSNSSITEVKIPNTTVNSFLALLEYMYTDDVTMEDIDSFGILVLADEYGLSRLVNLCELNITKEVERSLDKNNKAEIDLIGIILTAQAYNADQLSGWCLQYIANKYDTFEKKPEFLKLKGDNKRFVEENRWPPLPYLNELEKYEAEMKEWKQLKELEKCESEMTERKKTKCLVM